MRTTHPGVVVVILASLLQACTVEPPKGTQIGAIREPDPDPQPPSDLARLDMNDAVADALRLAGIVTSASAFQGHVATLDLASTRSCPQVWVGVPPDNLIDIQFDDEEEGLSWLADCASSAASYDGFTHWTTDVAEDGSSASRTLIADASVSDPSGTVLWAYDGESSDTLEMTGSDFTYRSSFAGVITGSMSGLGKGLRAQNNAGMDGGGGFVAEWASDGTMRFSGSVEAFDGYGPIDQRNGSEPELSGVTGWKPGQPRFTSVRFDLTFDSACAEEPVGFVGLRGNEGFWFDIYFLPIYDPEENTAQSNAFPYENIDNVSCDGIGTLFSRNADLEAFEQSNPGWSRELSPDFGAILQTLPTPTIESYVYTLHNLPTE
ncbi:MAG: hypothetical protein KC621_14615 [Myxococcales bacterium]|nr:hypothetical protein [Myxococcales bacterium]